MSMAPGFIAVCLSEIPRGPLAVDLHYPMGDPGARKLVRVHPSGSELGASRRMQMITRGIRLLWIRSADEAAFNQSLNESLGIAPPKVSEIAQCALDACLAAETPSWEEVSYKAGLEIVCRWINRPIASPTALSPVWDELSRIALSLPWTTHSVRVATLAVLFAMAFEHESPQMLSELAISGFLHDLGKLELGIPLAGSASQAVFGENGDRWKTHCEASIRMIDRLGVDVSENSRLWILQHHERFGGGGYPQGLEGYKVNDISQLLAAADLVDELASGSWDENRRGIRGAFEALEGFDREKTFPQCFNPALLKAMVGWSKRTKLAARSDAA